MRLIAPRRLLLVPAACFLITLTLNLPTWAAAATQPSSAGTSTQAATSTSQGNVVGWLKLSGKLRDAPPAFAWADESDLPPSLHEVIEQLHHVATQDQYLGVVVYLDAPELSRTQVLAIGEAMQQVRQSGKKVLAFAQAYDLRGYLLASYANLICLQHHGVMELAGMSMEEMYLAGLLDKIGVKADLLQIGKYKGAREPFTRTGPSKAWSENVNHLLDDMYAQVIGQIAKNRSITTKQVEDIIHDSWQMSDKDYVKNHVVDRLVSRDMVRVSQAEFGNDFIWDESMGEGDSSDSANPSNPFAFFRQLFAKPRQSATGPSIAVIHALGDITGGDSHRSSGPFGGNSIGSQTMVRTLGDVGDNSDIKGVVIRVDSPGGGALASEVIWQAIHKLAQKKPVYMSVGGMAASGAYYISSASNEIYVSPESIVGSIGVVGGKVVFGGLYEKLGIHVTHLSRGPWGDMFNSITPFTPDQKKAVRASMVRVYQQFRDRVKAGRGKRLKKPLIDLDQGRIFTGREAVANGLADHIGTLGQTIAAVAKKVHLKPRSYDIVNLPGPMSLQEFLKDTFNVKAPPLNVRGEAILSTAAALLGPRAWGQVRDELAGLMQLRTQSVLMLMPVAIVVR